MSSTSKTKSPSTNKRKREETSKDKTPPSQKRKTENPSSPQKKESVSKSPKKQQKKKQTENASSTEKIPPLSNDSPPPPSSTEEEPRSGDIPVPVKNFKGTSKDQARNATQIKLWKALGDCNIPGGKESSVLAAEIEQCILNAFGNNTKQYQSKFRSLYSNISDPKNDKLRSSLFKEEITPERLIQMSYEELANPSKQEERKKTLQYTKEARMAGRQEATCTMFHCHKCGKNETTYHQMQTRSADEPMTTFVTCCYCGNHWKC